MTPFVNPFPVAIPASFDPQGPQSIILPGSATPGSTGIHISAAFPSFPTTVSDSRFPKTVYESFALGLQTCPTGPCLGRRAWDAGKNDWAEEYTWIGYDEVDRRRGAVGSALVGLFPGEVKWNVGVWCPNQPEWQLASLACAAYSLAIVSVYDTLGPTVVEYMLHHSSCRVVFASAGHVPALLALTERLPMLKYVVSVDSWRELEGRGMKEGVGAMSSEMVLKAYGKDKGIVVMDMQELELIGERNILPHRPPTRDDLASICYTSGTTGNPKGCEITHKVLAACLISVHHGGKIATGGTYYSFLPLSHIYERFCEDAALSVGIPIGYSCGNPLRILEDCQILRPTSFVTVPRVLNRLYQSIKAATIDQPGLRGAMCRRAVKDKIERYRRTGEVKHGIWDRLIFDKISKVLGGKVDFILTGSAPINPDVLTFLKIVFKAEVIEGYGSTENSGTAVGVLRTDWEPAGTVGAPRAGMQVKLIDVPSMEYFATDLPFARGELLTRGDANMPGYYLDPVRTAEALDTDGWIHSGDIASIDHLGRFTIIDRIKNIVKLSQGLYIAVERIENVYLLCPLIAQILVHGDSLQDHVVGIVVPDPITFAPFASRILGREIGVDGIGLAMNEEKVEKALKWEMDKFADGARLKGFERVKEVHSILEPFTMENNLLTPTMKMKRNIASQRFRAEIDRLYARTRSPAVKL